MSLVEFSEKWTLRMKKKCFAVFPSWTLFESLHSVAESTTHLKANLSCVYVLFAHVSRGAGIVERP